MNNKFVGNKKYGWDALSIAIGVIGLIVWRFIRYGFWVGIPLIIYAFWRSRSKDLINRKKEEEIFQDFLKKCMKMLSKFNDNAFFSEVRKSYYEWLEKVQSKGKYGVVTCPRCKKYIRIKKKKGGTMISCPKCLLRFRTKI